MEADKGTNRDPGRFHISQAVGVLAGAAAVVASLVSFAETLPFSDAVAEIVDVGKPILAGLSAAVVGYYFGRRSN